MNNELLIKNLKSNNSEVKSNNEEKQIIEEMAQVIKDYTERNHIMASHVILECYAEELYSKNYRKQSEMEWLFDDGMDRYCSNCGANALTSCFEPKQICTPYCPMCGAKMKGGEGK